MTDVVSEECRRNDPFLLHPDVWVAGLVTVGVLARVVRYLACFPLWEAETYAAATLVERNFSDLLRPLEYQTVCPLGFLWVEWLAIHLLGCSEYALRLFPLICGIGSIVLFAWVCGRVLSGPALPLSVAFFAVAYNLIRQSAECRQYASDLFFAVLLIALGVGYRTSQPGRKKQWWAGLAAVLPLSLLFSLPSIFVAAGVLVALGWSAVKDTDVFPDGPHPRQPRMLARLALVAALALLLAVAFGVLGLVYLRPHYQAARSVGALHLTWKDAFPPLSHPGRLALWLLETHTGRMFAYPAGGPRFGSLLTSFLFVLGCVEVRRRRNTTLLLLVLAPFLAGFGAAALGFYPYGATDRLVVYLAPAICLMAGLGAATLLQRLPTANAKRRALLTLTLVFGAFGLGVAVDSLVHPYKDIDDDRARRFAQSFWKNMARGAEVVSLHRDLRIELEPDTWLWSNTGWRAAYRYYRVVYGPPPWQPGDPRWRRIGADHPLRAVAWTSTAEHPPESETAWLASISGQYRLRRKQVFPVSIRNVYLIYELVPIHAEASPLLPFPTGELARTERDRPD